jgi:hypothetical protein
MDPDHLRSLPRGRGHLCGSHAAGKREVGLAICLGNTGGVCPRGWNRGRFSRKLYRIDVSEKLAALGYLGTKYQSPVLTLPQSRGSLQRRIFSNVNMDSFHMGIDKCLGPDFIIVLDSRRSLRNLTGSV